MKQTRRDPALPVLGGTKELAGFTDSAASSSAQAGAVARDLIAIRSLPETEERVLESMLESSGAEWAALYRPADGGFRLARALRDPGRLPRTVEAAAATTLLDGKAVASLCEDEELKRKFPNLMAFCRLHGEVGGQAAVILLGGVEEGNQLPPLPDLAATAEVCATALRNAELVDRLQSAAFVDFVTGCYNRRAFEEHLNVELVRARRYERPLCLLLLDLDDFKLINDAQGHQVGDYVLKRIGETLRSAFRTTDRVCRYGGDEFAVIFPETPKADVLRLAERLRRDISKLFPDAVILTPISSSIGVSGYPGDGSRSDDLVKAADRALYRAKHAGRNQVVQA